MAFSVHGVARKGKPFKFDKPSWPADEDHAKDDEHIGVAARAAAVLVDALPGGDHAVSASSNGSSISVTVSLLPK